MEIFDDETYDKLNEAYEKAFEESPRSALLRAIKGELPFSLDKKEEKQSFNLAEASLYNEKLIRLTARLTGQKAEAIRDILERNKKELPICDREDIIVELKRYENPFVKVCRILIDKLECAGSEGIEVCVLLSRAYTLLSLFFMD